MSGAEWFESDNLNFLFYALDPTRFRAANFDCLLWRVVGISLSFWMMITSRKFLGWNNWPMDS